QRGLPWNLQRLDYGMGPPIIWELRHVAKLVLLAACGLGLGCMGRRHCSSFSLALSKLALEDLPRRVARQKVDELDKSRRFIISDTCPGISDDLRFVDGSALFQDDESFDRFARVRIFDADNCRLAHARVLE